MTNTATTTTASAPRPARPHASRRYPDVEVRAAVEAIPLHLLLPIASVLPVELARDARERNPRRRINLAYVAPGLTPDAAKI